MSTMPADVSGDPLPVARRRRRLLIVALATFVGFAGLLLAAEIVARIIVWAWRIPTAFEPQPFHHFGQTDPRLWWKVQPDLDTSMMGVRLQTNHLGFRDDHEDAGAAAVRIYCLGDSATFGWRVTHSEMFTEVAERALRTELGRPVDVISAGVPGYTSYQCLQQFRQQIAPRRPDIIVIFASNNECRARNLGDRERGRLLARKEAVNRWLGVSRIWLLIARAPQALSRTWDLDPPPGRVANTRAEYGQNLRELIAAARAADCRVVVMNMPLRLRLEPSWKHYDRPTAAVARLLRQAEDGRAHGVPCGARRTLLEAAVALQPVQFRAHWLLADLESEAGNPAEAERQLVLAREGDLHPEAAKPSYNQALAELCRDQKVRLIELDRAFHESPQGEDALFLDHCHPSPAGHAVIGRELARVLSEGIAERE